MRNIQPDFSIFPKLLFRLRHLNKKIYYLLWNFTTDRWYLWKIHSLWRIQMNLEVINVLFLPKVHELLVTGNLQSHWKWSILTFLARSHMSIVWVGWGIKVFALTLTMHYMFKHRPMFFSAFKNLMGGPTWLFKVDDPEIDQSPISY